MTQVRQAKYVMLRDASEKAARHIRHAGIAMRHRDIGEGHTIVETGNALANNRKC